MVSFMVFDESSLDSVRRMEELPLQNWQLLQCLGLRVACPSLGLGPGSCMCGVPAISRLAQGAGWVSVPTLHPGPAWDTQAFTNLCGP